MSPRISRRNVGKRSEGSQTFLLRVFIITLIPVAIAGAIFLSVSFYIFLRGATFLSLKELKVKGNRRVPTKEILAIAGLEDGPNILALDIKALNRRLGQHPWIERAMTKRVFPDGIEIVIRERNPMAVIHLGTLYYVDEKGVIFDQAEGREKGAYPILTGIRREDLEGEEKKARMLIERALHLLKVTHNHKILPYQSISQIHLDRAIGLLVYTTGKGLEIRMGFGSFETKLQRLSKIWSVIQSMELSSIDCTIPGRIIVQQKR